MWTTFRSVRIPAPDADARPGHNTRERAQRLSVRESRAKPLGYYSWRSAMIGSTRIARRAGR